MGYTSVSDVENEWNQRVPDSSLGHVAWLIEKAELIVAAAVPNLAARITAEYTSVLRVQHVVAAMVVRVLRNPEGKQAETAGDYSYQLASGSTFGRLYLAPDERSLLGGRRRASSIPLDDDALAYPLRVPYGVLAPREWVVPATGEAP